MLDNSTKPRWIPDGRDIVDEHGTHIGTYADPSTAHYKARLHNNHVSRHPVLREVDLMFQSEIHFGISACWDGGIDWFLGLSMSDTQIEQLTSQHQIIGNAPTIEEALADMVNAARKAYPQSTFARLHQGDVEAEPDQRGAEDLVIELSVYGTVSTGYDVAEASRPDGLPWTVEVDLNGTAETAAFAGASQIEALRFALDSLNDRAVSSEA